jgi:hypothetical protein
MCTLIHDVSGRTSLGVNAESGVDAEQPAYSACSPSRGSPLAWFVRLTGTLEETSP